MLAIELMFYLKLEGKPPLGYYYFYFFCSTAQRRHSKYKLSHRKNEEKKC